MRGRRSAKSNTGAYARCGATWRSRYYVYAIDYDRGGEWMGQAVMCTREKEFTIRGIDDRLAAAMTAPGFPNLVPGATGLDRAID